MSGFSKKYLLTICLLVFCFTTSYAQDGRRNLGNVVTVNVNVIGQFPGGDLKDRFGSNMAFEGGMDFITEKGNWIFGWQANFRLGANVSLDAQQTIAPTGLVIGNGGYADFTLKQRGFYAGGYIGKLFSLSADNPRSGIRVTAGAGFLQHRIRLQQDATNPAPQFSGDYAKGYDRLTNGPALSQFIGYQVLGKNKLVNLTFGLEFIEAFTQNRRSYDFVERRQITDNRFDFLTGIKIGWVLPFYVGESTGQIYY